MSLPGGWVQASLSGSVDAPVRDAYGRLVVHVHDSRVIFVALAKQELGDVFGDKLATGVDEERCRRGGCRCRDDRGLVEGSEETSEKHSPEHRQQQPE